MDIGEAKTGDVLVLTPVGRLDSDTAKTFEGKLFQLIDGGAGKVLVDFSSLQYISSAGLRSILLAAKKLKSKGGRFALCSLSAAIKEVFDVSGFSSILDIHAGQDQGVAALK